RSLPIVVSFTLHDRMNSEELARAPERHRPCSALTRFVPRSRVVAARSIRRLGFRPIPVPPAPGIGAVKQALRHEMLMTSSGAARDQLLCALEIDQTDVGTIAD